MKKLNAMQNNSGNLINSETKSMNSLLERSKLQREPNGKSGAEKFNKRDEE